MTHNPHTIIQEVGEWAQQQPWHPNHAPALGIIEEVGELNHAILKNFQGIRGFDDPEYFKKSVVDALGDAMVYLSHWCYLHNTYYLTPDCKKGIVIELNYYLIQLLIHISQILVEERQDSQLVVSGIVYDLSRIAMIYDLDLIKDCLIPTWDKVKKRNWNLNKATGEGICNVAN